MSNHPRCHGGGELAPANSSLLYEVLTSFSSSYKPVHTYLSISICILGTISNIANIVVLTRPSMRTAVNTILTGIATCDMIVMLSNLVFLTHFNIVIPGHCSPENINLEWAVFTYIHSQLSVIGHSTSIWLSVAMGHLRYSTLRSACGSVRHRKIENEMTHSYVSIGCVFLFVTLCNVPNCLSYTIRTSNFADWCPVPENSTMSNITVYRIGLSDLGLAQKCLLFRIAFWMSGLLYKMIPCFLLTGFITVLVRILAEVKSRRARLHEAATPTGVKPSKMAAKEESTDRTTRMLITVICVFLATELPQGAMSVATGFFSREFRIFIYNNLGDVLDLLSLINACSTFVIYCSMSKQYRGEFSKIFLPQRLIAESDCSSFENPSVFIPHKLRHQNRENSGTFGGGGAKSYPNTTSNFLTPEWRRRENSFAMELDSYVQEALINETPTKSNNTESTALKNPLSPSDSITISRDLDTDLQVVSIQTTI